MAILRLIFKLLILLNIISDINRAKQAMKLKSVNEPNLQIPLYLLNRHLPSYQALEIQEYMTSDKSYIMISRI